MSEAPTLTPSPDGDIRLNERDAEIHRALAREDEGLAGLFTFFLRAIEEIERPGGIHMLGHAGRELSRGVLGYLAGESSLLIEKAEPNIKQDEKNRHLIARALRLPLNHPSVTSWFKAHNALVSVVHYSTGRARPSSRQKALAAANALRSLLWSRTGPFFGFRDDVNRLLAIEIPTAADITTLRTVLSRPSVRWDFFRRLEQPAWVAPLTQAGFFDYPPDVLPPDEDGRQRLESWAEGEYLRRMAGRAPAEVREALERIPESLRNPVVWDTAAEAAKAMPVAEAVKLVPLFRKALGNSLPWMLQETLGELAVQLAEAGRPEAFGLARDALRVVEGRPSFLGTIDGKQRKDATLFGLDDYEAEQLLPKLADALDKADPQKALKFFVHRLEEALAIEWTEPSQEPTWDLSLHWCPDLSEARRHHGFKEQIAVAIARLAANAATKSPADAERILAFLNAYRWRIFRRMRLFVLAEAGRNAQENLSAVVGDTQLVAEEYPPHEYILVLRNQFQNASTESQRALTDEILRGPGTSDEIIARLTTAEDDEAPTSEDARKYRVRWQRKRLRRFGRQLPEALTELAAQLEEDVSVEKPQGWELELEDKGHASGMLESAGPRSPLTKDELEQLSAEQLVDYLRNFRPLRERFDSPTPAGLATVIATRIREEPLVAGDLAPLLPGAGIQAVYVRGVLEGIVGAADERRPIPWPRVLPLVAWVANQPGGNDSDAVQHLEYGEVGWRWAQREAAKLTALAAERNLVLPTDSDALWSAAEAMVLADPVWEERTELPETMDAALTASLNTVAGESVEALMEVALWNYRLSQPSESAVEASDGISSSAEPIAFVKTRLRDAVAAILRRVGPAAYTARVRLGQYLPQLMLMDRAWVLGKATDLFGDDFSPPLTNPVWGGYIVGRHLYDSVFENLRGWYVRAVEALPMPSHETLLGEQHDSNWSTTRHLVLHCLLANLRGLASIDDADGLVSLAFSRSPIADRSHAYWEIYRAWRGPVGSVPEQMIDRLLKFWSWRLDVLSIRTAEERNAEAVALGWLSLVNALPDSRVLPLLVQTAAQAQGEIRLTHMMWERMARFAEVDLDSTIAVAEKLIEAELKDRYPHFNLSEVGPVLKYALTSEDPVVRRKATDLVNLLGDSGFTEFGTLLT